MTISLKADASGNSGSIQVAGVDRLTLNIDGSLVAGANPATGNRSMTLATMQKFADEFVASKSASGYQKLPSGLIIQWGSVNANSSGVSISFPIAFPVFPMAITLSPGLVPPTTTSYFGQSPTGVTIYSASSAQVYWIAIGY